LTSRDDSIDVGYGSHLRHQLALPALLVRLDALPEALSEGVGVESSALRFSLEAASGLGGVNSRFPQQVPDVVQVPALESLHHTPELLGSRLRQAIRSYRRRLWLVVIAVQQRAACVPIDDQLVCQDVELDDPRPRSPFRPNELDTQLRLCDQREVRQTDAFLGCCKYLAENVDGVLSIDVWFQIEVDE